MERRESFAKFNLSAGVSAAKVVGIVAKVFYYYFHLLTSLFGLHFAVSCRLLPLFILLAYVICFAPFLFIACFFCLTFAFIALLSPFAHSYFITAGFFFLLDTHWLLVIKNFFCCSTECRCVFVTVHI